MNITKIVILRKLGLVFLAIVLIAFPPFHLVVWPSLFYYESFAGPFAIIPAMFLPVLGAYLLSTIIPAPEDESKNNLRITVLVVLTVCASVKSALEEIRVARAVESNADTFFNNKFKYEIHNLKYYTASAKEVTWSESAVFKPP